MEPNDIVFLAAAFFLAAGNQLQPNTQSDPYFGEKSALRKAKKLWDAHVELKAVEASKQV